MLTNKKEPPYYEVEDNVKYGIWEGRWYQNYSQIDPYAVVARNTLGSEIVWTRISAGIYHGTVTGITLGDWTFIQCSKQILHHYNFIVQCKVLNATTIEIITQMFGGYPEDNAPGANGWYSIQIINYKT